MDPVALLVLFGIFMLLTAALLLTFLTLMTFGLILYGILEYWRRDDGEAHEWAPAE